MDLQAGGELWVQDSVISPKQPSKVKFEPARRMFSTKHDFSSSGKIYFKATYMHSATKLSHTYIYCVWFMDVIPLKDFKL